MHTMTRRCCSLLIVCVLSFVAAGAAGQEDPSAPPPPPPAIDEAERGESAADTSDDAVDPTGWTLLEGAIDELARGNREAARRLLEELAARYPNHPATEVSAQGLAYLQTRQETPRPPGVAEDTSGLARAELAFFQTTHGIILGAELCTMIRCDDPQLWVGSLAAGGALGLTLSLAATSDGITPGHALLLNSGTTWGFVNGLLLSIALDQQEDDATGLWAATQLAGLGAGALIWDLAKPTDGAVSMANSGGFWTGFLTLLAHGANEFDADAETVALSMLVTSNLGIAGGAALSRNYPMSRGRTFVIDSGGVLGFLLGIGTYTFIEGDVDSATAFSVSGMLGTAVGLGTSAYLTRDWDVGEGKLFSSNWSISPTDGGALLSLDGRF